MTPRGARGLKVRCETKQWLVFTFHILEIEQILWNMIFSRWTSTYLAATYSSLTYQWLFERKNKCFGEKMWLFFGAWCPASPSSWPNVLIHNLFKPWILSNFPRPLTGFDSLRSILPEMVWCSQVWCSHRIPSLPLILPGINNKWKRYLSLQIIRRVGPSSAWTLRDV